MNLFRAEIARIAHRRLTKVTTILLLCGIALVGTLTFFTHSSAAPDLVLAQTLADQNTEMCLASYETESYGMTGEEIAQNCYSDPAWFVQDSNFHLQSMLAGNGNEPFETVYERSMERSIYLELDAESNAYGLSGTLTGLGVLLVLGGGMLGASFIGADWRSGGIESQLVRQPNRAKLFAAKFAAIALTTGVLAATTAALVLVAVIPAAIWRGDTNHTGPDFWLAATSMVGRIGVAAALIALVAASISMLARNTAAGVGVGLVAFIVGGMLGAMEGAWTRFVGVPQNLSAWISHGDVGYVFVQRTGLEFNYYELFGHDYLVAGALMLVVTVGIVSLGVGTFMRRDVS